MTGLHITWFRQDLRVHDHAALRAACQTAAREGGQVLALFVWPKSIGTDVASPNPGESFLLQALTDLRGALAQRDCMLHLRHGDALEVLSTLHTEHRILSLHTHESWLSDPQAQATEAWALRAGVSFRRHAQFRPDATPRGHESWQTVWERFMARPRHEAPDTIPSANIGIGRWPDAARPANEMVGPEAQNAPSGGRKQAVIELRRFLGTTASATPSTQSGLEAFERLRPHLELGAVSLREVWQAAVGAHQQALKAGLDIRAASIASFLQLLPSFSQPPGASSSGKAPTTGRSRRAKVAGPGQQMSLGLGERGR